MNIFQEIMTLCIQNPDVTINMIISVVAFLAMIDTIHEYAYPGGIPVSREKRAGYKFKSVCFFTAMCAGNAFYYSIGAIIIVSVVSTIHLFTM